MKQCQKFDLSDRDKDSSLFLCDLINQFIKQFERVALCKASFFFISKRGIYCRLKHMLIRRFFDDNDKLFISRDDKAYSQILCVVQIFYAVIRCMQMFEFRID